MDVLFFNSGHFGLCGEKLVNRSPHTSGALPLQVMKEGVFWEGSWEEWLSVSVATGSGPENLTSASWKVTWEECSQSELTLGYSTLPGAILLSRVIFHSHRGQCNRIQKYNHTCMINWFSVHYSSTSGIYPMPTNRRMDKWIVMRVYQQSNRSKS